MKQYSLYTEIKNIFISKCDWAFESIEAKERCSYSDLSPTIFHQ